MKVNREDDFSSFVPKQVRPSSSLHQSVVSLLRRHDLSQEFNYKVHPRTTTTNQQTSAERMHPERISMNSVVGSVALRWRILKYITIQMGVLFFRELKVLREYSERLLRSLDLFQSRIKHTHSLNKLASARFSASSSSSGVVEIVLVYLARM